MFGADNYKKSQNINEEVCAVQWYVGSRKRDFFVDGINALRESTLGLPIEIHSVADGDYVKKGEAALTITAYGTEAIKLGCMLEVLVYHSLWYRSTVMTYLTEAKIHLESHGFYSQNTVPKIRRGCTCIEQAKVAEEVFEKVFAHIPDTLSGIADHSTILINGEDYAFATNHAVMVDTFDKEAAYQKISDQCVLIDSGDLYQGALEAYERTVSPICIVDTVTREAWHDLVIKLSELPDKHRFQFSIGSEVFQKVSRDDLDIIYKPCARMMSDGKWEAIGKASPNKETHAGYISPDYFKG